ncbi:HetP family heterocyst commitment protein [Microcoleus sp. FACHB-68]|uniref:HetP family heterocyst commitment protein n=1 Tax=Microcoleus sp. FACHB-68 TaxID=2692826 RepID=UPI00168886B3|nr:HetP family heterocyst commitment protein [Microcoleus sp. FACHB-68]MBD1936460.1 HetP family heterocyst commitment protein [Microcoleus sp. FACHB-68]
MYQPSSYSNSKVNRTMSAEQLEEIIDSILAGKYSWACVLLLRFAGYNPLHYIPYRTYNRLVKDNSSVSRGNDSNVASIDAASRSTAPCAAISSSRKAKVDYLEVVSSQPAQVCNTHLDAG